MRPFFSDKFVQIQKWLQITAIHSVKRSEPLKEFAYTVLVVDDDPDFCSYLDRIAVTLSIKADKAYTMREAKQRINEKSDYKAYIIDGHLPDGSGFELVEWIRGEKGSEVPIAFLSRIYQDAASFRILKEKMKVKYVVDKPLRPEEVQQLFHQLCFIAEAEEIFPAELMDELKQNYEKTIYDKLDLIEKLILALQKDPSNTNLNAFRVEVHKISGSSGSYGFPQICVLCKKMEGDLTKVIDGEAIPDEMWLSELDVFYTKMKMGFQGL